MVQVGKLYEQCESHLLYLSSTITAKNEVFPADWMAVCKADAKTILHPCCLEYCSTHWWVYISNIQASTKTAKLFFVLEISDIVYCCETIDSLFIVVCETSFTYLDSNSNYYGIPPW